MKYVIRTLSVFAMAIALGGFSIGCETMEGAGRDVERAGDKIEDAAD